MLKLKLQYFGHLMWRTDSLEKTLMLGKTESERRRDDRGWESWMASPTLWTWILVSSGSWWWTGKPSVLQSMGLQRVRHDWVTELNWYQNRPSPYSRLWRKVANTRRFLWVESKVKVIQSCQLFATPWIVVHGILQARILEWVAFPFCRGSSQPRDWTQVSYIAGRLFTSRATREAQEYLSG